MTIKHVLPGEPDGDYEWFYRQTPYEQKEIKRQVAFKRETWPGLADGSFARHPQHVYPQILPIQHQDKAIFQGIMDEVFEYIGIEGIDFQSEFINLISAQAACLNFLFPFKMKPKLASDVFKSLLPELESVDTLAFEYTGPQEATAWLGEPEKGRRDLNHTGVDAALFWRDKKGKKCVSLIEWKYTERTFGVCSAYHQGSVQVKASCQNLNVADDPNPGGSCDLVSRTRLSKRRYWDHMEKAGINLEAFERVPGCPFQGPFFQLMRQTQLAAYLRLEGGYDYVELISMTFSGNRGLYRVPRHLLPLLGITRTGDIIQAWNKVLTDVPPVRPLTVEQLMKTVDHARDVDLEWRLYLKDRYGV